MKILSLFLFLFLTISCKEEKNSVENILLYKLKETSEFYETASNKMIMANFLKNDERSYSNKETKQFFNYSENANKTLIIVISKSKEIQINEFNKFIDQINSKSRHKFDKINESDIENLSNKTSFYFIKNAFYKNLHQKLLDYTESNYSSPYCGTTIYDEEEKYELMKNLKKMKVQEFKDSICKSN